MDLPFDGGISRFYKDAAPDWVKATLNDAGKKAILNPDYPYKKKMRKSDYEAEMAALQVELVRLQAWARDKGERIVIVFEGRDAAGKGGTISRFRENLNPRNARVVALSKPSEVEATQWYFQRYVEEMPSAGEIVLFDRSWYNRGVVEHVFGFCTPKQREKWFSQVDAFEKLMVDDGIKLFKIWLNVGQATQLKRFLDREADPLKQWKLSWIDVEGLNKWDDYTTAIDETLTKTNSEHAPWTIVRSDDKGRARLNAVRSVLSQLEYSGRRDDGLGKLDPKIAGGIDLWHG
ncbi:MAG: polyphosphate kinase 2 [Loktanella sp.]|jgi:polyphosphate kinase|nr:polyphosphate kinase 2 [Loktanella sp.]MDO7617667.1 polyphosphate kinase 2 [Planktomarina temperata]MDO7623461.1 polyphosphate kinase 2 [Loktanella sp.]MDO7627238.1 polyphosphate kinase 2 [Loktanella sp.]MDO7664933.1 polyphosphate kinase 2 [Loktanella sp.]